MDKETCTKLGEIILGGVMIVILNLPGVKEIIGPLIKKHLTTREGS